MDEIKKPIRRWPWTKPLQNGTDEYLYPLPSIMAAVIAFIAGATITLFCVSWNFPFAPFPKTNISIATHTLHFFNYWFVSIFYKNNMYYEYSAWVTALNIENNKLTMGITLRHILATILGAFSSYKTFKSTYIPVSNSKQIRGKILLTGKKGFEDLKFETDKTNKATGKRAIILGSEKGFNPNKSYRRPKTLGAKIWKYIKELFVGTDNLLWLPLDQWKTHFLIIAGTRRGKSVILKFIVFQIYKMLAGGSDDKLIIIDTPKGEYAELFDKRHTVQIAPDEEHSSEYHLAADLEFNGDIENFWAGRIKKNDKDPYWTDSATLLACLITVFLKKEAGSEWNMALFAYFRNQPQSFFKSIASKYYKQAYDVVNSPDTQYQTHKSTLSTNTKDFDVLGELWNGSEYKNDIHQMTVGLLHKSFWINFFIDKTFPITKVVIKEVDGESQEKIVDIKENNFSHYYMKGILNYINDAIPGWKWNDLANLLMNNIKDNISFAIKHLPDSEKSFLVEVFMEEKFDFLLNISDEYKKDLYDKFLKKEKELPIALGKVNIANLKDIILGLPFETHEKIALDYLNITLNRFDINAFSKLVIPIFKYNKIWDRYEATDKFSLRDFLINENPKKRILLLKQSGRFKSQTDSLFNAMLVYMAGICNDKFFPDDMSVKYPKRRKITVVIDELAALSNIGEFIAPALSLFSSKGICVLLATQDFSQVVEKYSETFVKAMKTNVGNQIIVGLNAGESADSVSATLGKKSIEKKHVSESSNQGITTTSTNYQVHSDEAVITPDEVNSKLGANQALGKVRYLYIPGVMEKAYILNAEIVKDYKVRYVAQKAKWMLNEQVDFEIEITEKELFDIFTGATLIEKEIKKDESLAIVDLYKDIAIKNEHVEIEDIATNAQVSLKNIKEEISYFYNGETPIEDVQIDEQEFDIEKSAVAEVLLESMFHSPILNTLKHAAEVNQIVKKKPLTNEEKFKRALAKKQEMTLERDTQSS